MAPSWLAEASHDPCPFGLFGSERDPLAAAFLIRPGFSRMLLPDDVPQIELPWHA
jgi:hypothetical protein